jgi:hypothetical protein|tara:strand:+ start:239 stop:472 length:234 start_codon:yes stop_codon:yes gene_type:complete
MTTNNKDMNKFLTEMDRLDEQFTEDLVEEFVDDIRQGKNRNISFNNYRKKVIDLDIDLDEQEEKIWLKKHKGLLLND